MMINITEISKSQLISLPFRYVVISNFLSKKNADFLFHHLPEKNNYRSVRNEGSDKTYDVVNNLLLKLGDTSPNPESNLSDSWISLINDLQSEEYITALSSLLNEDLSKCYQEITLKRYGYNHYISPHTDKAHVRATHMLFLNDRWEDSWGGNLCLIDNEKNTFKTFSPVSDYSVAFVRSDISWHSVDKIICPDAERVAIQVVFWNIKSRRVLDGRIEHSITV